MQIYIAKKILDFFNYFHQKKISNELLKNLGSDLSLVLDVRAHKGESILNFNKYFTIKKIIYFKHHYDNMVEKDYAFAQINNHMKIRHFNKIFKLKMPFRKIFEYIYLNAKKN